MWVGLPANRWLLLADHWTKVRVDGDRAFWNFGDPCSIEAWASYRKDSALQFTLEIVDGFKDTLPAFGVAEMKNIGSAATVMPIDFGFRFLCDGLDPSLGGVGRGIEDTDSSSFLEDFRITRGRGRSICCHWLLLLCWS